MRKSTLRVKPGGASARGGRPAVRFTAACLSIGLSAACAATQDAGAEEAEPGRVVFKEDFSSAASLQRFVFSDPAVWRWEADSLALIGPSSYEPPHRSPRSIALFTDGALADFVLEARLMQTGREYGHRDLCLFFGFQDPANYYYVHLATTPDQNAHNVFLVDDAARRPLAPIASQGVAWGTDVWHRVRLEREGATIRVSFDAQLLFEIEDATHGAGWIGFGSFDDRGRVDDVKIRGRQVEAPVRRLFRK